MTNRFELRITNQHWLGSEDACSHGGVRAVIDGTVVTSDKAEYGVSQSALGLLRTLEMNHTPAEPVNGGYLLCHGCGYPVSFGCGNFGTDWVVRHERNDVFISQPRTIDAQTTEEFDLQIRLGRGEYGNEIASFAAAAREFCFSSGPRTVEEWAQKIHDEFWAEFDERLARAKAAIS